MSTEQNQQTEDNWVEKIGAPAYESIREMVAALLADRQRLDELTEQRQELLDEIDAEEDSRARKDAAIQALADWDADNAQEFEQLRADIGDTEDEDDARQRIEGDALSVEIRSGWTSPGSDMEPEEYRILLTTGGPAVQIVGDLDQFGEPMRARLMVQDWWKPWTEYLAADQDTLLAYARVFSFAND